MIKKNDCVPQKVLNERKLRRQAIAVMISGLVVAFLLGLIVGWFIPKEDKKNVTASAEGVNLQTSPSIFNQFNGVYYAPISQFVVRTPSKSFAISFCASVTETAIGEYYLVAMNELEGYTSGSIVFDLATKQQNSYGTIPSDFTTLTFEITSHNSPPITVSQSVVETVTLVPSLSNVSLGVQFAAREHAVQFVVSFLTPYPFSFVAMQGAFVTSSYNLNNASQPPVTFGLKAFEVDYQGLTYTASEYLAYGKLQNQAGYDRGYTAGVAAGGNNNFMSLITAVVDAPIKAFTSLLDFDILGYNMKNLALALLTAGLLVAAIRFFSRL